MYIPALITPNINPLTMVVLSFNSADFLVEKINSPKNKVAIQLLIVDRSVASILVEISLITGNVVPQMAVQNTRIKIDKFFLFNLIVFVNIVYC